VEQPHALRARVCTRSRLCARSSRSRSRSRTRNHSRSARCAYLRLRAHVRVRLQGDEQEVQGWRREGGELGCADGRHSFFQTRCALAGLVVLLLVLAVLVALLLRRAAAHLEDLSSIRKGFTVQVCRCEVLPQRARGLGGGRLSEEEGVQRGAYAVG
jgi:hypothetical protein